MNAARVRREVERASRYFDFVESDPAEKGNMKALVALQTSESLYTLEVCFPDTYPNCMPDVRVRKPALRPSPHRYGNREICFLHPGKWNPGRHDLTFVIQRAAKWLAKYEVYQRTREWPGAEKQHGFAVFTELRARARRWLDL